MIALGEGCSEGWCERNFLWKVKLVTIWLVFFFLASMLYVRKSDVILNLVLTIYETIYFIGVNLQ